MGVCQEIRGVRIAWALKLIRADPNMSPTGEKKTGDRSEN